MKTEELFLAAVLATAALNSGCTEMAQVAIAAKTPRVTARIEYGVVERIQIHERASEAGRGVGAVYRITVRLDGGAVLETDEACAGELRVGDRIRFVNSRVHRE